MSAKAGQLLDELETRVLSAMRRGDVDLGGAVGALFTAGATFIALLPESEWRDTLNDLVGAMPGAIEARAAKLQDAGIVASRPSRR